MFICLCGGWGKGGGWGRGGAGVRVGAGGLCMDGVQCMDGVLAVKKKIAKRLGYETTWVRNDLGTKRPGYETTDIRCNLHSFSSPNPILNIFQIQVLIPNVNIHVTLV